MRLGVKRAGLKSRMACHLNQETCMNKRKVLTIMAEQCRERGHVENTGTREHPASKPLTH